MYVLSFSLSISSLSAEYVIEFEDQGSTERGWEEMKRVGGNKNRANLSLWPYMSYRFRVIAINDVGKSDPSKSSDILDTLAEGKNQSFVHTLFSILKINCKQCYTKLVPNHSSRQ